MECPFELPLEKKIKKYDDEPDGLIIAQADGLPILTAGKDRGLCGKRNLSRQLDYIVQAINSHEKLLKALKKYGDHEPCCVKGDGCNCGFEQALKEEAEK